VQLEQTLRACVIGPLPPLPSGAAAGAGGGMGLAGGRPGCLSGSGGGAMLLPGPSGGLPAVSYPSGPCVAIALDAMPYSIGLQSDTGITYHPIIHQQQVPMMQAAGGLPGAQLLSNDTIGGAALWTAAPAAPMNAAGGGGLYAAAGQPQQQYSTAPFWWQQQAALQQPQQQAQVPATSAPQQQHRQAIANLVQIQKLRDQLRAAEEAELVQMVQAEAVFNTQQAAAAAAAANSNGFVPLSGNSLLLTGGANGIGLGGAGGVDSADLGGFCSTAAQLFSDLPPGLHSLLTQQPQQTTNAQPTQPPPPSSSGGGSGSFAIGFGGAVDVKQSGTPLGTNSLDLGAAPSGGLRLLPAIWGSGAIQSELSLPLQAAISGPLQSLHHQQLPLSTWPPPAFGADMSDGASPVVTPTILQQQQRQSGQHGSPMLARAAESLGSGSSWSFTSVPGGIGSLSSGPGSSCLGSSSGGSASFSGAGGSCFARVGNAGSFSGSGASVLGQAQAPFCGQGGGLTPLAAGIALATTPGCGTGATNTPSAQPSTPQKQHLASSAASDASPNNSGAAAEAAASAPRLSEASGAAAAAVAGLQIGGGEKTYHSAPLSWMAPAFKPAAAAASTLQQAGGGDENGWGL